jgi:hypothetical protein
MGVVDAYNVVQGELLQSCQTGGHVEDILVGRGGQEEQKQLKE